MKYLYMKYARLYVDVQTERKACFESGTATLIKQRNPDTQNKLENLYA